MDSREEAIARDLSARVRAFLEEHNPATTDPRDFLGARFDAGLAWVHFPRGYGGLELFADISGPDRRSADRRGRAAAGRW